MKLWLRRFFVNAYKYFLKFPDRCLPQREMTKADEEFLRQKLNFSFMADANNIRIMSRFTPQSREEFARKTGSLVLYPPDEATLIKALEEKAVLYAAPPDCELKHLNGINIGCGDRRISEYLTPVDIMREGQESSGAHHAFLKDAVLANPEDLPFKAESIDYIVALHMLEHVANPMEILLYWETVLKPGGGVGLILPNFDYTWNAAGDQSQFGHKWNASPEIFERLFNIHLQEKFQLEKINTLTHKISFDVILRKRGSFKPFVISTTTNSYSGFELAQMGKMASQFDEAP